MASHYACDAAPRTALRHARFSVPRFNDAPRFSKWQPRLGAAWDIFNNSSSIVHGFSGQDMDDTALSLASFGSTLGSVTSQFDWFGGATGNAYDPDLSPTYSNEANLGFTQRIWTNTSVDVTAVWRESQDIFEDTCVNQETRPFFWMTNAPGGDSDLLSSEYRGVIAKLEARPYSWLSGLVSYTGRNRRARSSTRKTRERTSTSRPITSSTASVISPTTRVIA